MSNDSLPPPTRKLPVLKTVTASYLALLYNVGLAARLLVLPLVLYFVTGLFVLSEASLSDIGQAALIFGFIVYGLVSIPMVTAWHRLVIMGHGHPDARLRFSLQRTEWHHLVCGIKLIAVLILAATLPAVAIAELLEGLLMAVAFAILFLVVMLAAIRLSLVLPAAAVGQPMALMESWRLTAGNTWRLVLIHFIIPLPLTLLFLIVVIFNVFTFTFNFNSHGSILLLIESLLNVLIMLITTSVSSWSYRVLVEGKEIVLPHERGVP